jgi:hypothetical protein
MSLPQTLHSGDVRDTGRRNSLIREICFFGGRVVEHDMAPGNWVDGARRRVSDAYSMNLMVEARNRP